MKQSWDWTRGAVQGFSLAGGLFFLAMVALFVVQSLPAWRHEGFGLLSGTRWFFRAEEFGMAPMIYGTLAVSAVALALAAPVGLATALFLRELLPRRLRLPAKASLEVLAGIPSVVYGLLGVLLLRDWMYRFLEPFEPLSGDTLLTGGVLLAVMVLPTVITLADDALGGVPASQRLAARGLGLNRGEVILKLVIPQALPGLAAAVLLALGRALGETIAVFLVVGRQDNQWPERLLAWRPLTEAGQTLTSKLGGSETHLAYGEPLHWAAICALALVLLALVSGVTLAGLLLVPARGGRSSGARSARSQPSGRSWAGCLRLLGARSARPQPPRPADSSEPRDLPRPSTLRHRLSALRRRFLDGGVSFAATAGTLVALIVAAFVMVAIVQRGAPVIDLEFLVQAGSEVGTGGIRYQLLGTVLLLLATAAVSVPISTALALAAGFYLPEGRWRRVLSLALYTANGIPSIVFGVFGLLVFVKLLGWGKSWLAGGILLGLMIVPTVTVNLLERIRAVPGKYLQAAAGLGLRPSQVVRSVVLPQSLGGLVSGLLLGLARAAGETAPILFAAAVFSGVTLPDGIRDSPVLALPYHIFVLAQDSFQPEAQQHLWGAALVLLALVTMMSLAALPARFAAHEEARRG